MSRSDNWPHACDDEDVRLSCRWVYMLEKKGKEPVEAPFRSSMSSERGSSGRSGAALEHKCCNNKWFRQLLIQERRCA